MNILIRDLIILAILLAAATAGMGIYGIVTVIHEENGKKLEELIADQAEKGLKEREDKDEQE